MSAIVEPELPIFDETKSLELLGADGDHEKTKRRERRRRKMKLQLGDDARAMEGEIGDETDSKNPELTWSQLLDQQCPYLRRLIASDHDHEQIDPERLEHVMRGLNLNPCTDTQQSAGQECLERNCAILWQEYVKRKHRHKQGWKTCGNTLVDPSHYTEDCAESRNIADHMFNERDTFSYRPGDLSFLYDLAKLQQADPSQFGALERVQKKRGSAVLKTNNRVNPSSIRGNNIIRFLQLNHPELHDYFTTIYSMQVGSQEEQPRRRKVTSTNMYVLMEAMDGSMTYFQRHFQNRDPYYWNRLQRMLTHALMGLCRLHDLGFSHNDVKPQNLLYKLDWDRNLVSVKWGDFDCVGELGEKPLCTTVRIDDPLKYNTGTRHDEPNYKHHDLFSFGILVYELLMSSHPAGDIKTVNLQWKALYTNPTNQRGRLLHTNLKKLLDDNPLQPLSTVAYHFTVNELYFHQEARWGTKEAIDYLKKHPIPHDELPPLPITGELPRLPRPYMDW